MSIKFTKKGVKFNVVQFSAVHDLEVQCSAVKCSSIQCSEMQCSAVHLNKLLRCFGTMRYLEDDKKRGGG